MAERLTAETHLTEAQMLGWRTYIEASLRLDTRLEDELRAATGLSLADYHVLLILSEAPEQRLRMRELAAQMVYSPSRLTYQITTMETRGLVVRESSPNDRRSSRAVLTASGLLALRRAAPHHRAGVSRYLIDDLDDAELDVLTRIFGRVNQRLGSSPEPESAGPSHDQADGAHPCEDSGSLDAGTA